MYGHREFWGRGPNRLWRGGLRPLPWLGELHRPDPQRRQTRAPQRRRPLHIVIRGTLGRFCARHGNCLSPEEGMDDTRPSLFHPYFDRFFAWQKPVTVEKATPWLRAPMAKQQWREPLARSSDIPMGYGGVDRVRRRQFIALHSEAAAWPITAHKP